MLAVDFGVASGSISASIGIYIRLEAEKGSLTGYFRLRGEVDVLGLISASIELYLELTYHFESGKMVGRRGITIEVDGAVLLGERDDRGTRQFAGSKGDPSLRDSRPGGRRHRTRLGRLLASVRARGGGDMTTEWFTAHRPAALGRRGSRRLPRVRLHDAETGPRRGASARDFEVFPHWGRRGRRRRRGDRSAARRVRGRRRPPGCDPASGRGCSPGDTPVLANVVPDWQQRDWRTFDAKGCTTSARSGCSPRWADR